MYNNINNNNIGIDKKISYQLYTLPYIQPTDIHHDL